MTIRFHFLLGAGLKSEIADSALAATIAASVRPVKVMPERRLRLIRHLLRLSIMPYWVYVLTNKKNGVLYTGVTNDLAKRIVQHRSGTGSLFTAKYKLGLLVYAQEFGDPVSAIAAEKAFKKWRRTWKVALIERDNPEWRDLLEDRG